MGDDKEAFYVVRKGDIVGIYKNLSDCPALLQSCSQVSNPSISVFKGYGLSQKAEEKLASLGLKNAIYTIGANDVRDDLFGQLTVCPLQQPAPTKENASGVKSPQMKLKGLMGSTSCSENNQTSQAKLNDFLEVPPVASYCCSCILWFDGASKGNPGPAGAGAVLRAVDGSMVYRLREGVGIATNNVAEYRGLILGLRYALERSFKHINVQGDSRLVCMQIQGLWKTKNPNMADLCKLAKELKDKFVSFQISHVERALNTEADNQANLAVTLRSGEIQVDYGQN